MKPCSPHRSLAEARCRRDRDPRAALSGVRPCARPAALAAVTVAASLLWLVAGALRAAPAAPGVRTLTQPDGSQIHVVAWGDEWVNGLETPSGLAVVRDAAGQWVFGHAAADGTLEPTPAVVGRDAAPSNVASYYRPVPTAASARRSAGVARSVAPAAAGIHRLLVLLVDFTPSVSRGTTAATWNQQFFAQGGGPASVSQYWLAASNGRVDIRPAAESQGTAGDGIVAVTLGRVHPDTGGTTDGRNAEITRDALAAANAYVNFAGFDANADGALDTNELHVLVVVRGGEAATAACSPSVWAHRGCLNGGFAPILDGVTIGDCAAGSQSGAMGGYTQIGESQGCTAADIATIGVACHELGHDLGAGLPDLYDYEPTVGTASAGVGVWSLMASGSWNRGGGLSDRQGTLPALPDAWSRWFLGCLTPTQVTTAQQVTLVNPAAAPAPARGVVQILANPGGVEEGAGSGEYFLLENRARLGFDAGLPADGLLIWHIDERQAGNWDEGTGPAGDHRLVALEQADGRYDLEGYFSTANGGDAGDPWGAGGGARFADDTTPSARLHGDVTSGVSVASISAPGSTMTAFVSPAAATGCLRGDADASGTRDSVDLAKLRRQVTGLEPMGSLACTDLDCTATVDAADVVRLRRCVAGVECAVCQ